jgi:hypothetical protein
MMSGVSDEVRDALANMIPSDASAGPMKSPPRSSSLGAGSGHDQCRLM